MEQLRPLPPFLQLPLLLARGAQHDRDCRLQPGRLAGPAYPRAHAQPGKKQALPEDGSDGNLRAVLHLDGRDREHDVRAVSYTHLTLPTN